MKVNFILPALEEATGKYWRSIKYSLFPPLGLGLLAGYLAPEDEAQIIDEHVQKSDFNDQPDLVVIEVYVTNANRAYKIAAGYRKRGVFVIMGGLHATAVPTEVSAHCDSIITGPAEEAWPRFLADFKIGSPQKCYRSTTRDLSIVPPIRRDLIDRSLYLVPDSIVVSRGCPHSCDFCYKDNFYKGGSSFYTANLQWALNELSKMPGKHTFFLDDNIFADQKFSMDLFSSMRGMKKVWQGAATIQSLQNIDLLDIAVDSGLRSLFIGFESLSNASLTKHNKHHNDLGLYTSTIKELQDRGIMINASFVFGMEEDDEYVFKRTVEWAVNNGLETATFHILTPYPGTALYQQYKDSNLITSHDWSDYDTRHAVFKHSILSKEQLENGYSQAYQQFYSWRAIWKSARNKKSLKATLRHLIYTGSWKKFDPLWQAVIAMKKLPIATPVLERLLNGLQ